MGDIMFFNDLVSKDRQKNYDMVLSMLPHYCNPSEPLVTTLANVSALLNAFMDDINWVGFYIFNGKSLYLGPFQGAPACTTIALGSGVCGEAAHTQKTVIVDDVLSRENHITCDTRSRSEIVVPIIKNNVLLGVLDVDSPNLSRFSETDKSLLEKVVKLLVDNWH